VDPPSNQFRAINSTENVTFSCDVTGDDVVLGSREAVWAVLQRQIPNEADSQLRLNFAAIGIIVERIGSGITNLTITSEARVSYFDDMPSTPNITVLCAAFSNSSLPTGEVGDQINVTTFGKSVVYTYVQVGAPSYTSQCVSDQGQDL
jgi:hypothetical protein